eukprot:1158309-Pelagomonas_calceolata.AAC.1
MVKVTQHSLQQYRKRVQNMAVPYALVHLYVVVTLLCFTPIKALASGISAFLKLQAQLSVYHTPPGAATWHHTA